MRLILWLPCFVLCACHGADSASLVRAELGPSRTPCPTERSPGPPARLLPRAEPLLTSNTSTDGPVDVQLAAARTAFEAGRPLTIGLTIQHDPGYHTYWRFPGVVGLATRIRWNLPPGFRAGPLRWARPERTKMAVYKVWGYERQVALLTDITPPAELASGQVVEIKADAMWMACAKDCNPGFKRFTLRVPVASVSSPRPCNSLFETMRRETPVSTLAWSFRAEASADGYRLTATPKTGALVVEDAYLFNSNSLVDSNRPQSFRATSDGGFVLDLHRWEYAENSSTLEGVLTCSRPLTVTGERSVSVVARLRD